MPFDKARPLVYNRLMMKKQILNTILNTIEKQQLVPSKTHIVLGLSGGPDSVCLFDVLCDLAEEREFTIYPVHVNHKFRPGDAEKDQAYVEELCVKRGWPCRTFVYDCNAIAESEKLTAEEAGRKVRYASFAAVARELRTKGIATEDIVIAVAQNADDQAETILFRVMRGAGTDGLAGIGYCRLDEDGNRIVRPLLDCSKKDILAYCQEQNLNPRMDCTNEEAIYTRNKIRLELIPYLEREYNPAVKDTMIRMGRACAMDRDFLWETAREEYTRLVKGENEEQILFEGEGLRQIHRSIRHRVLSLAFERLGLREGVAASHFDSCEVIVFHEHPSAQTDLPKGYTLCKHYGDIRVCAPPKERGKKQLRVRTMSIKAYEEFSMGNSMGKDQVAAFDGDAMEAAYGEDFVERICLKTREAGDTIAIGEGKRKKLQDYFVDRKIPKLERDHIEVVKIGHDVLWVPPYEGKGRFCSNFKLCADTKNVICIEIICVV